MMDNHEVLTFLRNLVEEKISFNKHIGLKVESFDPEAPKLRFDMSPELIGNPFRQILHGGVISTTFDMTGGFAIMMSLIDKLQENPKSFPNISTIDLHLDYLRPGTGKYFIATGNIVRKGTRIVVAHMKLHNDEGVLIATGGATYSIS